MILKTYIRELLKEASWAGFEKSGNMKGWLSPDAVDFLIKKYAVGKGLKWEYTDIVDTLGKHDPEDWSGTYAAFDYHTNTMYIDREMTMNDFHLLVEKLLHEIQHWNQNYRWETDYGWRFTWVGNRYWPDAKDVQILEKLFISDDMKTQTSVNQQLVKRAKQKKKIAPSEDDIDIIEVEILHLYWEMIYGYENSHHEKNADLFAASKKREAIEEIMKQDLDIDDTTELRQEVEKARGIWDLMSNIPKEEMENYRNEAYEDLIVILKGNGTIDDEDLEEIRKSPKEWMKTDLYKQYFRKWIEDRLSRKE